MRQRRQHAALIEERLQLIRDRIGALEDRLPTSEDRQDAEAEARKLVQQVKEAAERLASTWTRFLEALEIAERLGRELVEARTETRKPIRDANNLVVEHGLDLRVPRLPKPSREESRLAGLLGLWISQLGYNGEVGDTADRGLARMRQRAEDRAA